MKNSNTFLAEGNHYLANTYLNFFMHPLRNSNNKTIQMLLNFANALWNPRHTFRTILSVKKLFEFY